MESLVRNARLQLELLNTRRSKFFGRGYMHRLSLALHYVSYDTFFMNEVPPGIIGFKPNGPESGHLLLVFEVIPLAFAALCALKTSVANIRERKT